VCQPCHESCKQCAGPDQNSCIECKSNLEVPDKSNGGLCICSYALRDNICVTECEDGEYVNTSLGSNPLCQQCHSSCKQCIGGGEN